MQKDINAEVSRRAVKSKAERPSKRRGRPPGLRCPWLKEWSNTHHRPRSGEKRPSAIKDLAEALGKDDSLVSKCLNGVTGIDLLEWQGAIQQLVEQGLFSTYALDDFMRQCRRTGLSQESRAESVVEYFLPIQTRLVASLERGKSPDKRVRTAFSEASGLLCAWAIRERRFTPEQLADGLPAVIRMTERWYGLAESIAFGACDNAFNAGAAKAAHATHATLHVARVDFQERLAWWARGLLPATSESEKILKCIPHQQAWQLNRFGGGRGPDHPAYGFSDDTDLRKEDAAGFAWHFGVELGEDDNGESK